MHRPHKTSSYTSGCAGTILIINFLKANSLLQNGASAEFIACSERKLRPDKWV